MLGQPVPFQALGDRCLYLCTPDRPDLAKFVAACIDGGVDLVQFRDKSLAARDVLRRARVVAGVCHDLGVPFLLNDRPDLALEADADGVHLGQDDAPISLARRLLGPEAIVGLSTHSHIECDASLAEPADYISAGPVLPTPTKPGRPGTGEAYISYATARARRPVFVTGGVSPATVPGLLKAGASRFVVVRYLTEAPDPGAAARALRRMIMERREDANAPLPTPPGQVLA